MSELKSYYDQDYHGKIHGNLLANDEYFWARAHAFNQLYFPKSDGFENLKVLDYGCGLGQASIALPNAFGFDASEQARAVAKAKGLKVFDSIEAIPKGEFDLIICRHVLEHLENPGEILQNFATYLKPNGRLKLILPKEKHKAASFAQDDHLHLYAWNFRTINNLLSINGFDVKRNDELYHWGFSKLMPIRKIFGKNAYLAAAKAVGYLTCTSELYIEASLRHAQPRERRPGI